MYFFFFFPPGSNQAARIANNRSLLALLSKNYTTETTRKCLFASQHLLAHGVDASAYWFPPVWFHGRTGVGVGDAGSRRGDPGADRRLD